jgi:dTDP-4-dehydrorhamnose 3,5-epimerase
VDVRVGSPTFGHHVSVVLDDKEKRQLVVPIGFAHGFLVRSEHALVAYKCSAPFAPRDAIDIAWNDPAIGIDWGTDSPTLSDKDAKAPRLDDVRERLPRFKGER